MVLARKPHHFGFVVTDLAQAAEHWASVFGAGPFLCLGDVVFDEISSFDRPCVFRHATAFGQWGDTMIELQRIDECTPPALGQRLLPGTSPILNHVSYVAEDPEADSRALGAAGMPKFMHAKAGEVEARFHDATGLLGYAVELHRPSDFLSDFTARVKEASLGWDGRDPLRNVGDPS